MGKRLRWLPLGLAGLLLLSLVWFGYIADAKVTALRNVAQYKLVHWLGGPRVRADETPGSVVRVVRDAEGQLRYWFWSRSDTTRKFGRECNGLLDSWKLRFVLAWPCDPMKRWTENGTFCSRLALTCWILEQTLCLS
jgi:hypothetical protein